MIKIIVRILGFLGFSFVEERKSTSSSSSSSSEEVPSFLLRETIEEYSKKKKEEDSANELEIKEYKRQKSLLLKLTDEEAKKKVSNTYEAEVQKRRVKDLEKQIKELSRTFPWRKKVLGKSTKWKYEETLHEKEQKKILLKGRIVFEKINKSKAALGDRFENKSWVNYEKDLAIHRRLIVEFGKEYFLFSFIKFPELDFESTGESRNGFMFGEYIFKKYKSEEIDFVTSSVSKMTDEELSATKADIEKV
jgi:hypothetical protein